MDAFSDPLAETITLMFAAQTGKTSVLNNVIGFHVDQDTAPMLLVEPTLEMAMAYSKDRLAPMIRDTPCLAGKVVDPKAKESGNTILHKVFPGGHITIAGANSPASLASRPVRLALMDEVDRYPPSAGTEGDPVKLAAKRTRTFFNRKIALTSTPTIEGVSRIEFSFQQSDQRHFYVPCPKCRHAQKLRFSEKSQFAELSQGRLVWESGNLSWVYYECENCKAKLSEADKYRMVRRGKWVPLAPQIEHHQGFHLSELYSPFSTWHDIVKEFAEARKLREALKVWVNTTLAEVFTEEEAYTIDDRGLMARREKYTTVPDGVLVLVASVDVQDDRLEALVKGYGLNAESWLVNRATLYGGPDRPEVWESLDQYLSTEWEFSTGIKRQVSCVFVDSGGHFTQEVYRYVKRRHNRRYYAIKGYGGRGRPLIGKPSRNNRERAIVIPLGVDDGKTIVYDRLHKTEPGAGYMHFNESCVESYFQELTAEKKVVVRSKGFPTVVWRLKKDGLRNEALDLEVYALAAFTFLNPNLKKIQEKLQAEIAALKTHKPEPKSEAAPAPTLQVPRIPQSVMRPRTRSWVNKWR